MADIVCRMIRESSSRSPEAVATEWCQRRARRSGIVGTGKEQTPRQARQRQTRQTRTRFGASRFWQQLVWGRVFWSGRSGGSDGYGASVVRSHGIHAESAHAERAPFNPAALRNAPGQRGQGGERRHHHRTENGWQCGNAPGKKPSAGEQPARLLETPARSTVQNREYL